MADIISKGDFARLIGVSNGRVSQFLEKKFIYGDAIVGSGHFAKIRVSVAREQLKRGLDPRWVGNARLDDLPGQPPPPAAANGAAAGDSPAGVVPDRVEDEIKQARLTGLRMANERAAENAAARLGIYVLAADSKLEMGRLASQLMATMDAALPEFANGIAAKSNLNARDALHLMRAILRQIRERASQIEAQAALALPPLVEAPAPNVVDDAGADQCETDVEVD